LITKITNLQNQKKRKKKWQRGAFLFQKVYKMERNDIEYTEIVRALYDYDPTEEGCLQLRKGDLIYVQQKDGTGWWSGTVGNSSGWFPSNWIEPLSKKVEDIKELSLRKVVSNDTDEELPKYWRKKQSPNGQIYYYNTETNQTTYSLDEVKSVAFCLI
jgi:hypothetical protein